VLLPAAGHKVSLATAVEVVRHCCRYRVPEPIRQADIRSREKVRERERERGGTARCSGHSSASTKQQEQQQGS
jgi:hypothetical protein